MFCTVHDLVGKENGRSVYTNRRLALFSKVKGVGGRLIFAFDVESDLCRVDVQQISHDMIGIFVT